MTVSHDKGVQHNSLECSNNNEVYKNVAFLDTERRSSNGERRFSNDSKISKDSNGKAKEICYNDILINNLNGSQSSINSTQSSLMKV